MACPFNVFTLLADMNGTHALQKSRSSDHLLGFSLETCGEWIRLNPEQYVENRPVKQKPKLVVVVVVVVVVVAVAAEKQLLCGPPP